MGKLHNKELINLVDENEKTTKGTCQLKVIYTSLSSDFFFQLIVWINHLWSHLPISKVAFCNLLN